MTPTEELELDALQRLLPFLDNEPVLESPLPSTSILHRDKPDFRLTAKDGSFIGLEVTYATQQIVQQVTSVIRKTSRAELKAGLPFSVGAHSASGLWDSDGKRVKGAELVKKAQEWPPKWDDCDRVVNETLVKFQERFLEKKDRLQQVGYEIFPENWLLIAEFEHGLDISTIHADVLSSKLLTMRQEGFFDDMLFDLVFFCVGRLAFRISDEGIRKGVGPGA